MLQPEKTALIIGPGAVGLALAAGLRQARLPTAVLGRNAAAQRRLVRGGFQVTSPDASLTQVTGLKPATALKGPAGVAFFCVKSGDARRAATAAKRFIGSNTALVAPVTVGAGATVGAGSTIARDVPPGELALTRAEQKTVKGWKRPQKKVKSGKLKVES